MRMTVAATDGAPRQHFSDHETSRLEVLDFTSMSDAGAALRAWMEERAQRRFELNRCLYDTALIQLAAGDFAWYLNQHHLITDAWSMAVIFKRVSDYYALARQGRLDPSPDPEQFRDYIDRERSPRDIDVLEKARTFWRQKLFLIVGRTVRV